MVGVNLTQADIAMMNSNIDKVTISSTGKDGYCTYEAILTGIYVKRFEVNRAPTEEAFARALPQLYDVVKIYKEDLRFVAMHWQRARRPQRKVEPVWCCIQPLPSQEPNISHRHAPYANET